MCSKSPQYPAKIIKLVLTPAQFEACEELRKGLRSIGEIAKALGIDYSAAWERFSAIRKGYGITQDELISLVHYFPPANPQKVRANRFGVYPTKSGRFAARIYVGKCTYRYIGSYRTMDDARFACQEVLAGRPAPVPPHKGDERKKSMAFEFYHLNGRCVLRIRYSRRKRKYVGTYDSKDEAVAVSEKIKAGLPVPPSPPRRKRKLKPSVTRYKDTNKFAVCIWLRAEKRKKFIGYFDDRDEGYRVGIAAIEKYNGKESLKQV